MLYCTTKINTHWVSVYLAYLYIICPCTHKICFQNEMQQYKRDKEVKYQYKFYNLRWHFANQQRYCDTGWFTKCLINNLLWCVRWATTARRISLGGEGNALYPVLSSMTCRCWRRNCRSYFSGIKLWFSCYFFKQNVLHVYFHAYLALSSVFLESKVEHTVNNYYHPFPSFAATW